MTTTRWNEVAEAACIRAERQRRLELKTVTPVTPAPAPMADTSNNGAHVAPAGGSKMFRDTENAVICAVVAVATFAAFVAQWVA